MFAQGWARARLARSHMTPAYKRTWHGRTEWPEAAAPGRSHSIPAGRVSWRKRQDKWITEYASRLGLNRAVVF